MNKQTGTEITQNGSRRSFLKSGAMTALAGVFIAGTGSGCTNTEKAGGKRNPSPVYASDFIPDGASLKIAFVNDHHYWPNHFKNWGEKQFRATEERMTDLVEVLNGEAPDISLHGGDVIDAGTAFQPPFDEYVKQLDYEKRFLDALVHPAIPMIGNHEVPDTLYESENELAEWKQCFGPLYGFRDIKGWRLVWLNTMIANPDSRYGSGNIYGIDDTQMAWLDKLLREADNSGTPALLFAHIPPKRYSNAAEFTSLLMSHNCVKCMTVGHEHNNFIEKVGEIPMLSRIANVSSPLGYTLLYPYPDGRIVVVQKSQHFPFIDYMSTRLKAGAQGSIGDRHFTLYGSSELPLKGLTVLEKDAGTSIADGHLTVEAPNGNGTVMIDVPGMDNARISFSAVKEGATHIGVVASAGDDPRERVEGVLTSEYGPDGNMYLASHSGGARETIARSWFNISDGIAYKFVLEVKDGVVTMANRNMPELSAELKGGKPWKFGFFVTGGTMLITDLRLEKLG